MDDDECFGPFSRECLQKLVNHLAEGELVYFMSGGSRRIVKVSTMKFGAPTYILGVYEREDPDSLKIRTIVEENL